MLVWSMVSTIAAISARSAPYKFSITHTVSTSATSDKEPGASSVNECSKSLVARAD